jgi:hypothetical protein
VRLSDAAAVSARYMKRRTEPSAPRRAYKIHRAAPKSEQTVRYIVQNPAAAPESEQSVRYIVQNPYCGAQISAKCTIFRTKSIVRRPNTGKLYDISYKIQRAAPKSEQTVRYIVQNPACGAQIRANCTIYRTKSSVRRPNTGKLYDISYKIQRAASESEQTVRYIVQNPACGGRISAKCTIYRTPQWRRSGIR